MAARIIYDEPASEYHSQSRDYMSSHGLGDFRRCPEFFHRKQLGLIADSDSAAYKVGRAAHSLTLEGRQAYEAEFAFGGPINPKTGRPFGANTKAFAEWAAQVGKPVLTEDEQYIVEAMAASVKGHKLATELLSQGSAEVVVRQKMHGVFCQSRFDWLSTVRNKIVDLKTCQDLDSFERDYNRFVYVCQFAFYRRMAELAFEDRFDFYAVAVEKREPFRCGVWLVDATSLDRAQGINDRALDEYLACQEHDTWPTRYEEMRVLA